MRQLALTASVVATALVLGQPSRPLAAPAPMAAAPAADRLSLPPPKAGRGRPLVVIVGGAAGAETTDYIVPYAVLAESGAAEVRALSTVPGPMKLMLTLKIQPDQTTSAFEASEPEGADVVIVPAQMKPKDPLLIAFVQRQAAKGATIVSICEGARVLAEAGLLRGKRATTHFASLGKYDKAYPDTRWVRDRRYVQDGRIISTTGVTASIPASLALVEAMAGHAEAVATAQRLGVTSWSAAHRTADYRITAADYASGLAGYLAVWSHERVEAPLNPRVDEIAIALQTDAWQRTFRNKVVSTGAAPVRGRRGLVFVPEAAPAKGGHVLALKAGPPAPQLDAALADIRRRYGEGAARLARIGLEYDAPGRVTASR